MKPDDTTPPPLPGHCLNCATKLAGPFCSQCGQRDFDFRRSFWAMMHDAAESLFHIDGRITRGVVFLLFRPGRLTRDFLMGKRASQVPPLRFYLFITLVYFLTLPLRTSFEIPEFNAPVQNIDTISVEDVEKSPPLLQDFLRGIQSAQTNGSEDGVVNFRLPTRSEIIETVVNYTPKILFALLPLLALSTRILFWKSGYSYLEHLVIALHFGAFIFTFSMFSQGWSLLLETLWHPLGNLFSTLGFLYALLYPAFLLHHVFRRSIFGTVSRYLVLFIGALMVLVSVVIAFGVLIISQTHVGP